MHLWSWLVVSLVLAGRSPSLAPADPEAQTVSVNRALINARQVTLDVIFVNGTAAPRGAVEHAAALFTPYLSARPRIARRLNVQRDGAEMRSIGPADVKWLLDEVEGSPHPGRITIIVWPRRTLLDFSAHYRTASHRGRWRQVVVMHQPVDVLPAPVRRLLWTHVLLHELCHALRVPGDRSHTWANRHCTRPDCILYPWLDHRSLLAALLNLGPTWRLCDVCRAEVDAVRQRR